MIGIPDKDRGLKHARLRQVLNYDRETGVFTWNIARGNQPAGAIAGNLMVQGHIRIRVDEKMYFAHRLAWLWVVGVWPKEEIDHKNCIGSDNRWENLRQASREQNTFNVKLRKDNKTGLKGVKFQSQNNNWVARIAKSGKRINLGSFSSKEEASAAYNTAAREMFGEFARF